jgi:hypothetical protein
MSLQATMSHSDPLFELALSLAIHSNASKLSQRPHVVQAKAENGNIAEAGVKDFVVPIWTTVVEEVLSPASDRIGAWAARMREFSVFGGTSREKAVDKVWDDTVKRQKL